MRIIARFTKNNVPLPLNTIGYLNSYIHKCLGKNNPFHNIPGKYNVSNLQGGVLNKETNEINFPDGMFIIVSSLTNEFLNLIYEGIEKNKDFGFGMTYEYSDFFEEEFTDGWNSFFTLSPFIIKTSTNKVDKFHTINDDDFVDVFKTHLVSKLNKIYPHLSTKGLEVEINKHPSHKVKKILVHNSVTVSNQCIVSIKCSKILANHIYHMGFGKSTNSGFGTICLVRNKNMYRKTNNIDKKVHFLSNESSLTV